MKRQAIADVLRRRTSREDDECENDAYRKSKTHGVQYLRASESNLSKLLIRRFVSEFGINSLRV